MCSASFLKIWQVLCASVPASARDPDEESGGSMGSDSSEEEEEEGESADESSSSDDHDDDSEIDDEMVEDYLEGIGGSSEILKSGWLAKKKNLEE
ncbi:uncharacterized protein A4U43_C07F20830 [Asparagus officinalis]|uniref:Uncharacterized protein n=1 Tax=Asparagus officinalis TaxID=4686 RepID=A0A5P1EDK7_ASPOF|nr:uncharacterized protein A4U43_C07F20830 [Asparagus officinalis]